MDKAGDIAGEEEDAEEAPGGFGKGRGPLPDDTFSLEYGSDRELSRGLAGSPLGAVMNPSVMKSV